MKWQWEGRERRRKRSNEFSVELERGKKKRKKKARWRVPEVFEMDDGDGVADMDCGDEEMPPVFLCDGVCVLVLMLSLLAAPP